MNFLPGKAYLPRTHSSEPNHHRLLVEVSLDITETAAAAAAVYFVVLNGLGIS